MKVSTRLAVAFFGAFLAAANCHANSFLLTNDELTPEAFPTAARAIRAVLQDPNAPVDVTAARKQQVINSLERIGGYLASEPHRHVNRIHREQLRINSALAPQVAKNDGRSDVVCKRVKPVGSNIPQTVCRSRSQMKDQQYAAQNLADELRQLQSLEDCPPNIPIC